MNDLDDVLTPQRLRTMQIIASALLLGVLIFLAIAAYIVVFQNHGRGMAAAQDLHVVTLTAVVMFACLAPLAFFLPRMQSRAALRRIAAGTWRAPPELDPREFATLPGKLLAVLQTTMLIGLSMLEGTAFLGCIAYLLEAQPLAAGVIGGALFLMLLQFPTQRRVRAWVERQTDQLADIRQSSL
jgi:hypothetical protein